MSDPPSVHAAPLIVASNRGPLAFQRRADGTFEAQRGTGGLVTALTGALEASKGMWLSAAMTDGDRDVAAGADH
jgi:trehalose 6-phosphate synthase